MRDYLREPVSNGNPREQALIRRWWHETHAAKGLLVWEYHLEGRYADAIWFPDVDEAGAEKPGKDATKLYPIRGQRIVLCEAKLSLNPEVVGQALIYAQFAEDAGAEVSDIAVFCESGSDSLRRTARELGLTLVIGPL
ncbi:MAG: hypothetical protein IH986_12445 [Planctomycetes bacterium]|nr:hypothetical protein [Planctomycetota bacterium]